MKIIKKIIKWIINLFHSLFYRKNKVTKKIKENIRDAKNERYLKGYGVYINGTSSDSLPVYLLITQEDKNKILEKIKKIEDIIQNNNSEDKEKDLQIIQKLKKKIAKAPISIYQNEKINEELDFFIENKGIKPIESKELSIKKPIASLESNIYKILEKYDEKIKEKTINEYKKVNYVTVTTYLLDEIEEKISQLEKDFISHKHNKSYYDRELKKIKDKLEQLRKLRNNASVQAEILTLRKELYTKSKDKYDLLYNEEVFLNLQKRCDLLCEKANRKIIDLKKKEQEKKEEKRKENYELLEKIIKRFQDMELARKLILINEMMNGNIKKVDDLFEALNKIYYDFLNGEKVKFNYHRNATKTELVKLYNTLNRFVSIFNHEDYISLDHINISMESLLTMLISKKEEFDVLLKDRYHYQKEKHENSVLTDNKLAILMEEELIRLGKHKQLVKKNN